MSSSKETHSALYIATFRAITSDWSKYKHSLGTQNVILDMVVPGRDVVGFLSSDDCPAYIENEFLVLLGNILEGQTGPHIETPCRISLVTATSLLHTAFMCCAARRWKSSLVHGDRHCSAHHLAPLWTSSDTFCHSQRMAHSQKKEVGSFWVLWVLRSLCNTKLSVGSDRVSDRVGKEGRNLSKSVCHPT